MSITLLIDAVNSATDNLLSARIGYYLGSFRSADSAGKQAKDVKAKRESDPNYGKPFAYDTPNMMQLVKAAGELFTLSGEWPTDLDITKLTSWVKAVKTPKFRRMLKATGATVETVARDLKLEADLINAAEAAAKQTPESLLKAASGPFGKALEMGNDTYSEAAVTMLQSMVQAAQAKLASLSTAPIIVPVQGGALATNQS